MLIATWVLAVATSMGALTGLVAVVTWRENKRREREAQLSDKVLDLARKEFAGKESLDTRTFLAAALAILGVIAMWDKLTEGGN